MTTWAKPKGLRLLSVTAILAAYVLCSSAAFAQQFTNDYQTNIVSGVVTNVDDDYLFDHPFCQLVITNAGAVTNLYGYLGYVTGASNTSVFVSDNRSLWYNDGILYVGYGGAGSQLVISNGAVVFDSPNGYLGFSASSSNNTVLVIGPGSIWSNQTGLVVGNNGASNQVVVSNGGAIYSVSGFIGNSSSNNSVSVGGSGATWRNTGSLSVGFSGPTNQLNIGSNGSVIVNNNAYVGFNAASVGNTIAIFGGSLYVTNGLTNAVLDVRRGSLALDSGTATLDGLVLTNGPSGTISFGGGTLITRSTTNNNTLPFIVGNSTNAATLNLRGGIHVFVNGLDVLRGSLILNSATTRVDRLTLTNGVNSTMVFTGGVVITQSTTISNGVPTTVGDGTHPATLSLLGGAHTFADGLVITNNAVLTGTGTINANMTVAGILSPGSSPGTITNTGNLIIRPGAVLNFDLGTNSDLVAVGGTVTLGGTLNVLDAGGFGATNTYTLMTYSGSLLGGTLTVGSYPYSNVISGVTIDTSVPNKVNLKIGNILAPTASFTPVTSTQSLVATFIDTSQGPITNWFWQFGDTSTTNLSATTTNLVHTYPTAGNYTVTLIVSGATGSGTTSQSIHVGALPLDPYSAWAQQYFPCYPTCTQLWAGTADPDGDGVINTNEFLAGTVPTNGASYFHIISILPNGNDVVITWETAGGRTNVVQAMNGGATGYIANNLQDIGQPIIVTGSGDTTTNYVDVGGATNAPTRFYRVRLVTGETITNAVAEFRITAIARENDDIRITWIAGSGQTNALQATSGEPDGSFSTNNFADLFTVTNTTGFATNYLDVGAATNFPSRFYRVRLVP